MTHPFHRTPLLTVSLAVAACSMTARAVAEADLVVADVNGITPWGAVNGIHAYSFGVSHCNLGSTAIPWTSVPNGHPATGVNLLRIRDGELTMIGMSWMAHGSCPLQQSLCGTCTPAPQCTALGAGCSTASTSSIMGQQSTLGPRSQVDPGTGSLVFPFTAPPAAATIGRRLQVADADLDPALNAGAVYLVEVFSISAADAGASAANNASVRRVVVGPKVNGTWTLSFVGSTMQQTTAIELWPLNARGWGVPDPTMLSATVPVPGDGRLRVASRVTLVAEGTWRYRYAVLNQDSGRAVGRFTVALPQSVSIDDLSMSMPAHHSGEIYATDAWTSRRDPFQVSWRTVDFSENPNANALRYGVLASFSFDSHSPPAPGTVSMGLFGPGSKGAPDQVTATLLVPSIPGDLNGDGRVDGNDLGALLGAWDGDGFADLNGDGIVNGNDLGTLLGNWSF